MWRVSSDGGAQSGVPTEPAKESVDIWNLSAEVGLATIGDALDRVVAEARERGPKRLKSLGVSGVIAQMASRIIALREAGESWRSIADILRSIGIEAHAKTIEVAARRAIVASGAAPPPRSAPKRPPATKKQKAPQGASSAPKASSPTVPRANESAPAHNEAKKSSHGASGVVY